MAQPADTSHFCLASGEAAGSGLRRLLREQLLQAIHHLSRPAESLDDAVHEARKCVKRARSLLLLVGDPTRQAANQRLRAAGQALSAFRDAQVLAETLARLRRKLPASSELRQFAAKLRQTRKQSSAALQLRPALNALEQAAKVPTVDVHFPAVADAVKRTVKRGQKAFATAYEHPTAANFHEARKQAKHLRYQLTVITPLWPDLFAAYAAAAQEIEELLGDDQNLAVLAESLQPAPESPLAQLIASQQQKLRARAEPLSRRLYAESPKSWKRRLEAAWQAWH